jgi:hypothetical protein
MSVKDDWRAWLPEDKNHVFQKYVWQLDVSYNILSVSLDEAVALRQDGDSLRAAETVCVTVDLCERFCHPLVAFLWALSDHAKHHGTVPNTAPLDPANFQGSRAQRCARFNSLLSRVLLSERAQFLYKIGSLSEMVVDLNEDFSEAAAEVVGGEIGYSDTYWQAVVASHYDLNTCLREAIILLKSFLMALPDDELEIFELSVCTQMGASKPQKLSFAQRLMRHRRAPEIAGQ